MSLTLHNAGLCCEDLVNRFIVLVPSSRLKRVHSFLFHAMCYCAEISSRIAMEMPSLEARIVIVEFR